MEQEVKNYLSIIDDLGIKGSISKFYTDLCSEQKVKRLFGILFPYKNIYILSSFNKLLSESQFEDEKAAEKELNVYCDWFLKGYDEFEKAKMYDNDIFDFLIGFDYKYRPYFIIDDKIVISSLCDYGKKFGKCYAAWCHILNHQSVFEPLFLKLTIQIEPHFTRKFTPEQLQQLYTGLTKGGYLPIDTDQKAFNYVFGGNGNAKDFKPLEWTKTNSTTHGKELNKRSLLDLLGLLKVPYSEITDKKLLNKLFIKPDGTSIKFTGSNYKGTQINFNSEYNLQLQQIVSTIK